MAATEEVIIEKPKTKKVFLNNLDSFHGRNIGKFLSRCVIGATMDLVDASDKRSSTAGIESKNKAGFYEIVGTTKDKEKPKPDFAKEIVQYESHNQIYEYLVECDIIIYDINEDLDQISQAVWIITEICSNLDKIDKPKIFILISTCMTWDRTKVTDSELADIPFTDDDYRKRKPHPNFKEHISAEKTVLRLGKTNKSKLETYVICSGLTYGAEENTFHYLFKSAWHNEPQLLCLGDGLNIVPTIHIKDLAGIIQNVADGWSKYHYILAKDNSQNTLEEIVKAISNNLGSQKVKYISTEEAVLDNFMEQEHFDMLMVNLKMESSSVKEGMSINWFYENGMLENIKKIIMEYKESRQLWPLRAVILGPPASGKTTIAGQLCEFYKLHHILIKDVIKEEFVSLNIKSHHTYEIVEGAEEDEAAEKKEANEAAELLAQIHKSMEENNGRIEDKFIISFIRNRLNSMPCQNQGFILDGYPKTIAQAQELFSSLINPETLEIEQESVNKNIIPEFIINLEATDSFLKRKVMNLPESAVRHTHNTEKGLQRRLREYAAVNTYDETVLNYFDELELYSEKIDVTNDKSNMMKNTVEKIKKIFGNPRNYGSTAEELEIIRLTEEEGRIKRELEEKKEIERQEAGELNEKNKRQEDWTHCLHEVKKQEFELLEAQSIPLRNYLMKHVMPTLTQALIECCKARPEDPIDFLAEFLFQHNPQID